MKKRFTILITSALMLLTMMAQPITAWGQNRDEEVTYTLDGTITGGSSGYATESEITQNNVTWMVTGNTTMNPWRIGGKNLSGVDRPAYSTSSFSDNITKVVVTNGTATATVNSMTLIVSSNSDFSDPTSTITGTWTASATTTFSRPDGIDWSNKYFKLVYNINAGSSNQYAQLVKVELYKESSGNTPSISAENVDIDYNATSGSITYTINNPVTGGSVNASTQETWLTLGTVGTTVPFTCTANDAATARTATVTLTYTYGNDNVTKDVTVTQGGNPNVINNISDITAAGTYTVQGTIVAKSTRGFIVGDGTGYVYYYNQNYTQADYNIGDMVKLAGSVVVYGGVFEFNASTTITTATTSSYVAEQPTVLSGADMDARVASTTPPQLSNYVQYEGKLSISGSGNNIRYNITDISGATTAIGSISYPLNTDELTALADKQVKVKGYYVGISTSTYYNTMLGSIEEIVSSDPSITANNVSIEYNATSGAIEYTINNPVSGGSLSASTTESWLTLGTVGTTVPFTCSANDAAAARTATVTLTYTYGNDYVTKNVTVTQAGNPNVINNISDITAAGTYTVQGTIVAKSARGFIVGDGTGYAYYYNQNYTQANYNIGDMVKLAGSVVVYGNVFEFNASTTVTAATTSNYNGDPSYTVITEVPDYTQSNHLSDYFQFEGVLTNNGTYYNVAIGNSGIRISYPTEAQQSDLDPLLNKTVRIHGFFAGISGSGANSAFTVMMESIEEVAVPTITVSPMTVNAPAEGAVGTFNVTYTDIDMSQGIIIVWFTDNNISVPGGFDWIDAAFDNNMNIEYSIAANNGAARTGCFMVRGYTATSAIYSELVTINQAAPEAPHCTWNLTTNSYYSATANLVTWSSTNAIMTNAKGTSTTAANNYLGGGSNNHTRFYQNQVLTITPNTGFAIDSVLINATSESYGEGFYGNTWTNATTSAQGSVITVIPTDIDQPFSVVISKACRATTVTVYYEPSIVLYYFINLSDVTNGSIATDKTRALEGETVTLTGTPDNNYYVSDWSVIDGDNNPVSWTASGAGLNEVTFSMPASSVTVSATFETSVSYHSISFGNIENGTVVADPAQQALEGETVTLTVTPDAGYILEDANLSVYTNTATVEVTKVNSTTYTFVMPADDVTIMAVFTPFQASTYTLTTATTLESGRRYIIVGLNGENAYAMGGQNNNNRAAVGITMTTNGAQVSSPDVVEVVINGPDTLGYYTIYDANTPGYLYAASSGSNYLKTRQFNTDKNSQWTITFEDGNNAVITAQGNYSRNLMRYNSTSNVFSCYGSGQQAIYLYKKDEGSDPQYAFYKDIIGYGDPTNTGGYYLISCPVEGVDPANVSGLLNGEYDFYFFEQGAVGEEWQNYQAQASMNFEYAKGYLYANENTVTLGFFGTQPGQQGDLTLDRVAGVPFEGLNLIGNPFGYAASFNNGKDFYVMNAAGNNLIPANRTDNKVNPMEGIFVYADYDNEPVAFTTPTPTNDGKFVLDITKNRGSVIDRAVVRFGEGSSLPKFMLNPYSTKIYIPQDEQDYAAVTSSHNNEIPVSFEAAENGTYTLNLKINNTEMDYIHLIDNVTGNEVDLLQNPSYTFEANTTDYASRFRLVFSANSNSVNDHESNFGFISNGNLLILGIEGEATLQMIDLTGRILSTETFYGSYNKALNASAGVYMLRLIQGENVRTQKVIIK